MKTLFKIFLLAGAAVFTTSCEDVEPAIFNGADTSNGTFLTFSRSAYNLPVERDETGSVMVTLNASTLSAADRVYAVEVIPNTGLTGANPATYSVPGEIIIPANQYQGFITINGVDGGLVTGESKNFSIKLADSSLSGESMDSNLAVVNVYEVCPLLSPFVGNYQLTQVNDSYFSDGQGGSEPIFQEGVVVLKEGESPFDRTFDVVVWPNYNTAPTTMDVAFKCDFVNVTNNFEVGVGCGADDPIKMKPGANPESYDTTDDSVLILTVTNNSTGACGAGESEQITIQLTKID